MGVEDSSELHEGASTSGEGLQYSSYLSTLNRRLDNSDVALEPLLRISQSAIVSSAENIANNNPRVTSNVLANPDTRIFIRPNEVIVPPAPIVNRSRISGDINYLNKLKSECERHPQLDGVFFSVDYDQSELDGIIVAKYIPCEKSQIQNYIRGSLNVLSNFLTHSKVSVLNFYTTFHSAEKYRAPNINKNMRPLALKIGKPGIVTNF